MVSAIGGILIGGDDVMMLMMVALPGTLMAVLETRDPPFTGGKRR